MMGAGLRPSGKPEDLPPYPKMQTRRISIPTSGEASKVDSDDIKTGASPQLREKYGGNLRIGHAVSGVEEA